MSINKRGRKRKRGSILLLSIFFLIVLFSLSVAFFRIIPAEFHSASKSRKMIQANYAADSGGHHAVTWLKFRMAENGSSIITPAEIENYNVANFGSHSDDYDSQDWPTLDPSNTLLTSKRLDDNWSFLSRIRMDDSDFFRRIYTIESCSYLRGKPQRVVKMTVQNESFADFALYISEWDDSEIFTMGPNGIQGPVHTNGFLRLAAPDPAFWSATKGDGTPEDPWVSGPLARITQAGSFRADSTDPQNTLGLAGDGVQYANGNSFQANLDYVPYNDTGSPIAERYEKIVEGGRGNISQIGEIPMPEQNSDLREQAWGATLPRGNQWSSEWRTARNGDEGYVMVNTESGHPNVAGETVSGGIFISGRDTNDVLLDITSEGHQKVRVRQGNVRVDTPNSLSHYVDLPTYHRQVTIPEHTTQEWQCTSTYTVMVDDYGWETRTRTVTRQDGNRCGYSTVFIPGENGQSSPTQVANTCTFDENYQVQVVVGQHEEERCNNWDQVDVTVPEQTYWESCDEHDSGAVQNGTRREEISEAEVPQYENTGHTVHTTQDTHNIQRWNSVVEVNDTDYQIPYYNGMTINGETITSSTDPRLTVTDGHTVHIKNDYSDNRGDYAEYTVMDGRVNGVVFSDRHLWNVRGTNKGSKYPDLEGNLKYQGRILATNVSYGRDMTIKDSILQYYNGSDPSLNDGNNRLVIGETSPTPEHILGLQAEDIRIRPGSHSNRYENTDTANREGGFNGGNFQGGINVYAILMAGRMYRGNERGGFGADNSAMQWHDRLGDFNLYGGVISAESRRTQRTDNNRPRGFRLNLNYDPIAAEYLQYFEKTNIFSTLRYVTYHPAPNP